MNATNSAKVEGSFFRDFVDNSDSRLGKALLTEQGRTAFNKIKAQIFYDFIASEVFWKSLGREDRLLAMAMVQHAVSQILSEVAHEEDRG